MKLSVTIILIQHGACLKSFTSITGSTTEANIKLNVWWESYFYPRSLLFAAIKEITILFSTHWQNLWKSGEEDWQTAWLHDDQEGRLWPVGYEQEFIEDKSKSKNTRPEGFCLATKIRISFRDFQSFTGFFSKMTEFMGLGGFFFLSIFFVYMLHRRPHLHCRKQWHMRGSKRWHR